MDKTELFNKISNARNNAVNAYNYKCITEYRKIMNLANEVRKHSTEVGELCSLINYAIENGYLIQPYSSFLSRESASNAPRLQSDGISHTFGFVGNKCCMGHSYDFGVRFKHIGMCGGGCADDTLTLDENGVILYGNRPIENYDYNAVYPHTTNHIWWGAERRLTDFIKKFPTFKKSVMEFIENIESYKCYRCR